MAGLDARVAYVSGLLTGVTAEEDTNESRFFREIVAVLEDFAQRIEALESSREETAEYLDALDEALSSLLETEDEEWFSVSGSEVGEEAEAERARDEELVKPDGGSRLSDVF